MSTARFFRPAGPFSLAELATAGKAELAPGAASGRMFEDIAPLHLAGPGEVSFLDNARYVAAFEVTKAGACIVRPEMAGRAPGGVQLLLTQTPYHCFARIAQLFYPIGQRTTGRSSQASIDPTAILGEGAAVAAGAVIGAEAKLGRNCEVGPNAVIGPGVQIGDNCSIGANASVTYAILGDRVRILAGARIGEDGFGFAMDRDGHIRIPQLGRVVIEDDVEVGANSCIDRGSSGDTFIGRGTMIDNLVQIGHNVHIGRGCVLVSQAGVAGSARLGDHVTVGGQSAVSGHVKVGDGALILGKTGVFQDLAAGAEVVGYPAIPRRQFMRQSVLLARMAKRKTGDEAE